MSISAKVAGTELQAAMNERFGGKYLEVLLLNAPGANYDPSGLESDNAAFISSNEIGPSGGYTRQIIGWDADSAGAYTDDGVAMDQRVVVFEQDGSADVITFTHMALVWGNGNATSMGNVIGNPASADPGTYTNLPTTGGNGNGLTVNVTVINDGSSVLDYSVEIYNAGSGYLPGDTVLVASATLAAAGANPGDGTPLSITVSTVNQDVDDGGKILSVAKVDNQTTIADGNSAAFYINLKQFGFYSV